MSLAAIISLPAFLGAIQIGLIFGLVALGVFLSFRVLSFPDLTVEDGIRIFLTGGMSLPGRIVRREE